MATDSYNVLFLCTGNSARSIMAEATLNHLARSTGRFKAFSAGSHPKGEPNPIALALLAAEGIATVGVRSKSWDEFMEPGATPIHLVITVCDAAAGEQCPLYAGTPLKAHWGVPDPQTPEDFRQAYTVLRKHIDKLLTLPVEMLDGAELLKLVKAIGRAGTEFYA